MFETSQQRIRPPSLCLGKVSRRITRQEAKQTGEDASSKMLMKGAVGDFRCVVERWLVLRCLSLVMLPEQSWKFEFLPASNKADNQGVRDLLASLVCFQE